jgi:hypothetical protein
MALSIPERIRGNPAIPKEHQLVGGALVADLEDEATVWYEPPFDGADDRPHFVVLEPAIGVVVVMVFDQTEAQAAMQSMKGKLRVQGTDEVTNPLERATAFGHALIERFAAEPALPQVPVGGVAALPYLHRSEAEALDFDSVINLDNCLFREDLDASRRGEGGLERKLNAVLEGGLAETLTQHEEGAVRGILHPEVVIQAPAQSSLFTAPDPRSDRVELFRVMDRRQELLAKGLGPGHRVIRGVAGSGKTLVLVARARLLARLMPSQKILVTCFTRSLAGLLGSYLADHPNVEVRTLHSIMRDVMRLAGVRQPERFEDWPGAALQASQVLRTADGPPMPQFRAVLVDEAQDFGAESLRFAVSLAETHNDEQDVLVVADSAQDIYGQGFTWKDAGINARGRTRILRINYRNTREILAFAHDFLTADELLQVEASPAPDDAITLVQAESAERSGPSPTVLAVNDTAAEIAAVIEQVKTALRPDSPARQIAVLYHDGKSDQRGQRLRDALVQVVPELLWSGDAPVRGQPDPKDRVGSTDSPVVLSTIHSAKGLEFPTVITCGLGGRPSLDASSTAQARRTLYVGFTRATDELTVIVQRNDRFAGELSRLAEETASP